MNFKILIKVLLNALLGSVKDGLKTAESELDRLTIWQSTIYVMEKIVQTIKKQDSRNNLLIFVKVFDIILLKKLQIVYYVLYIYRALYCY